MLLTLFVTSHLSQIIQFCKYAGYVLPVIAALVAAGKYISNRWRDRRRAADENQRAADENQRVVRETNENVGLLLSNHLPHIEKAIKAHDETLVSLQSDVRTIDTKLDAQSQRLDDTKAAIHVLGESFLRHLENSAKETVPVMVAAQSKRRKARVH